MNFNRKMQVLKSSMVKQNKKNDWKIQQCRKNEWDSLKERILMWKHTFFSRVTFDKKSSKPEFGSRWKMLKYPRELITMPIFFMPSERCECAFTSHICELWLWKMWTSEKILYKLCLALHYSNCQNFIFMRLFSFFH